MLGFLKKLFGSKNDDCCCCGSDVGPAAFVKYVASALVDYPEDLSVESEEKDGAVTIYIKCRKCDNGKIIGKRGKTISAIRNLAGGAAGRMRRRVNVEVVD